MTHNKAPGRFLVEGGRFFDGARFWDDHALLVEAERILRFAPLAEFVGIEATKIRNDGGATLPGLFDCHVHLCFDALADPTMNTQASPTQQAIRVQRNAQSALAGGITALRDLGVFSDREPALRDEVTAGRILGPDILTGGFMTITGGHGAWIDRSVQVDGEELCRRKVREYVAMNVDWIKITASGGVFTRNSNPLDETFAKGEVEAIIDEASRFNRKVTAHALGAKGILNAVKSGIASIEHGFQLTDEIIAIMVEKGIFLIPTFSASESLLAAAQAGLGIPASTLEKSASFSEMRIASFKAFVGAGGRVAMGTDCGTPFNRHGNNAQELAHMVQRGLTPTSALIAATSNAAELLSKPGGRLAVGTPADLLLVSGDPEGDIQSVADRKNHRAVFKSGVEVQAALFAAHNHTPPTRLIQATASFG